jgi:hypothetical protein
MNEYDACGLFHHLSEWLTPHAASPYVCARKELRDAVAQLTTDARAADAKLLALYEGFYAHVNSGCAARASHFDGAAAWHKQNRDEIHAIITEVLAMHATAANDPAAFVRAWSHMPEKIRQARRRWEQRYTTENVTERAVVAAFSLPPSRGRVGTAMDEDTDMDIG